MASILVRPSASEPVTLAEARAHLRVTHMEEDALIAALITSARRVAEAKTGLCLITQGWTVFHDTWPENGLITLPLWPIRAITELAVFGEEDEKAVIEPSHYVADLAARPARLMLRGSRQWQRPGRALNGIAITVDAGFGPVPEDVPAPLRQAVLMLVAHWYAHRGDEDAPAAPAGVDALLRPHRAVRP